MAIADEVRQVGLEIAAADGQSVGEALNTGIEKFVGWPYQAVRGAVVDADGMRTEEFASVICVRTGSPDSRPDGAIPADAAAAVIDVTDSIEDMASFRAARARVALAKKLRKSPPPRLKGTPSTTQTLGIIFMRRSPMPVEDFVEELQQLNARTEARERPDMIVVGSTCAINYAAQFPGDSLGGDYLPPGEGALDKSAPAVYVVMIVRPSRGDTFNRMLAFLIGHLTFFSPGANLPNFAHILVGVSKTAICICGYQYNLAGKLVPVPREFYNDRYIPPLPMRIEDQQGNLLSTVQFLPWQDGGVILLKGKLPLVGLMVFLGKQALQRGGVVTRPPDLQVSYVLPISSGDFAQMLNRIQRQSNMVVRRTEPTWTVQKIADEGSASPFMARVLIGVMRLRDIIYGDPKERDKFDRAFELVSSSLMSARATAREISALWEKHSRLVASGQIARLRGRAIQVDDSIDRELRKEVESFLNASVRALKQGMQELAAELQINIGFMFQKQDAFERGIAALRSSDGDLAEYLSHTRGWSERLVQTRNDVEHNGWILPRVTYKSADASIIAVEPEISGQTATQFVAFMLDRLCCFVEEFTAHCLQKRMPGEITIREIPRDKRLVEAPERFNLTVGIGGLPRWKVTYHTDSFEDT